jgi:hypothetical protein
MTCANCAICGIRLPPAPLFQSGPRRVRWPVGRKQRPVHDDALRGLAGTMTSPPDNVHPGEGRYRGEAQAGAIALKGSDIMDAQTLLIIIVLVLLLGGGGWYGRGRWF